MIICEDCNKPTHHYSSESILINPGVYQTRRYWKCYSCNTVYVEVLKPEKLDEINSIEVDHVEKYPVRKPKVYTLDDF